MNDVCVTAKGLDVKNSRILERFRTQTRMILLYEILEKSPG